MNPPTHDQRKIAAEESRWYYKLNKQFLYGEGGVLKPVLYILARELARETSPLILKHLQIANICSALQIANICSAASDLGQRCLPMSILWDARLK